MDHFLSVVGGVGAQNTPKVAAFCTYYQRAMAATRSSFAVHTINDTSQLSGWPDVRPVFVRQPASSGLIRSALDYVSVFLNQRKVGALSRECGIAYDTPFTHLIERIATINRRAANPECVGVPPVKGLVVFTIGDKGLKRPIPENYLDKLKTSGTRTLVVACPTQSDGKRFNLVQQESCWRFARQVGGLYLELPNVHRKVVAELAHYAALYMVLPEFSCASLFPTATTPEGSLFQHKIVTSLAR